MIVLERKLDNLVNILLKCNTIAILLKKWSNGRRIIRDHIHDSGNDGSQMTRTWFFIFFCFWKFGLERKKKQFLKIHAMNAML